MNKVRSILLFLTFSFFAATGKAQTTEDSVKAAINKLFEGMKRSDAAMVRSAFAATAVLQTIGTDKEGNTSVTTDTVAAFAAFVGKLNPGEAEERIVFETIKIDGSLATVWAPYEFYYKGKFSHCGIDSFQLVRIHNEWVIQYLIDTRKRKGCE